MIYCVKLNCAVGKVGQVRKSRADLTKKMSKNVSKFARIVQLKDIQIKDFNSICITEKRGKVYIGEELLIPLRKLKSGRRT